MARTCPEKYDSGYWTGKPIETKMTSEFTYLRQNRWDKLDNRLSYVKLNVTGVNPLGQSYRRRRSSESNSHAAVGAPFQRQEAIKSSILDTLAYNEAPYTSSIGIIIEPSPQF